MDVDWETEFAAAVEAIERAGHTVRQLDIESPHRYFAISGGRELTESEVVDFAAAGGLV